MLLRLILLLLGSISTLTAGPLAGKRPNIIFILTDDQGYGDLSCHGNPVLKTPALDRLHAESIRLSDFHVAPMCTPTSLTFHHSPDRRSSTGRFGVSITSRTRICAGGGPGRGNGSFAKSARTGALCSNRRSTRRSIGPAWEKR